VKWITDALDQTLSHTHARAHTQWVSPGLVVSPSQRPLPGNTQHPQQPSMLPAGFEPAIPANEQPQNRALNHGH